MSVLRRILLLIVGVLPLAAQTPDPPQDLADASLEQLLNIKVVSAGRKAESLKTTAASVFVITSEDIRRSGMHSLPEVLRLAPGVQVARTISGHWAISIRGFNGDFANKLLVLIDGRVVYNDEWGGVFWDMVEMPLENIERIEVVRGPGAALWGPNAVNGVINILTRNSADTQGGLVTGEAGSRDANTSARYGGTVGPDATYRFTARYGDSSPMPTETPASAGGLSSSHGWTSDAADLRVDWTPGNQDTLFITGQAYQSSMGDPAFFITPQNPYAPTLDVVDQSFSGNALAQWDHTFSNGSTLEGRVSWDHEDHGMRKLPIGYTSIDSELQYHFSLGQRNDFVWGASYREEKFLATASPGNSQTPLLVGDNSYSSYLEDQVTLIPDRVFLIAAVNVGHFDFVGVKTQPTARLLWTPARKLTTWASVSYAMRTPTMIERGMDFNIAAFPAAPSTLGIVSLFGNPSAGAESVLSYEAGQRVEIGNRVSLDVSAFFNRYQHLLYFTDAAPFFVNGPVPYLDTPITFDNNYAGRSHGLEASMTWNAAARWRWIGGFSWLDVTILPYAGQPQPTNPLNNAPAYQWQLRSNLDLSRRVQLDTALYYTGAISTAIFPANAVPQHLRADLRLGWRPRDTIELSTGVQDAFEPYHAELPSLYEGQQLLAGRNVYGAFTWRF